MPRATLAISVYYFATFASLGVFLPFFPAWLEARGLTGLSMSAILALRPVMGVLGPLGFGLVADALALRGSLLRLACAGALVAIAVLAAAGQVGIELGFWPLFAVVLVFSFFRAPMTMLADTSALEQPSSYGQLRLWGSLGFLVMAMLAGWLIDPRGLAPLPLAIAALLAAALLAALAVPSRLKRPPRPVFHDARRLAASGDFRLFLLAALLWTASHSSYDLTISLHLRDLGASTAFIGVCWGLGTLAEVALLAKSARLLQRFGTPRLLVLGMVGLSLRWLLIGTIDSLPALLVLQPLHAVSFALMWVSALAFIKERAPAHILATAQGLFSAAIALGAGAGMLIWGPIYAELGGRLVFRAAAVVAAAGCVTAVMLSRARRSSQGPAAARAAG